MSCLSIYAPSATVSEHPETIPFPRMHRTDKREQHRNTVLERARLMHANRCCPECNSVNVEPLELNDGMYNAQGRKIPGTSTIVAFHCDRCYNEWAAN